MPGIHRDTDQRECGATTTVRGQTTVYVNGLLAAVKGDPNTHANGELLADINPGTVYFGNLLVVLQGSSAQPDRLCPPLGPPHCNPKAVGASGDVFVGGGGGVGGASAGAEAGAGDEGSADSDGPVDEQPPEEETPEPEPENPSPEFSETLESRINDLRLDDATRDSVTQAIATAREETGLNWVPVRDQQTGEIFLATNDYLRNEDGTYVRASADQARALAAQFGSSLPTSASQIDSIHSAANLRFPTVPVGIPDSGNFNSLVNQSNTVIDGLGISPGDGDIASGHLKTIGSGGQLYHGIWPDGRGLIQRTFSVQHSGGYADYSQGVRLVRRLQ